MSRKVALLGGSFDPPHLAHVQVIKHLLQSDKYDEVWVVPTCQNPFKEDGTPFEQRLAMCRLAFGELGERVQVRDDEKNLSGFAIELVRYLSKRNPHHHWTFVAGSDLKDQVDHWKDGSELKKMIKFEFFLRGGEEGSPFLPLSSTEAREVARHGGDLKKILPEKVADYVQREQLYRQ